jgi:sialic acid synthase SpsE
MISDNKPYVIGETAFHHQGEMDYIKKLIRAAADLNLDAIKFHLLFDVGDYFVNQHPAFETIKAWTFSKDEWQQIFDLAYKNNLDIIALCNDVASLEWVNQECKTTVKVVELHATGINDVFLLNEAVKFENTVMLGVGGSSLDQLDFAINLLKENHKTDLFLMYGFQNYPTDYKDINFSKISLIQNLFGLPVGYADHTDPTDTNNELITTSAILKGVNVLEKHFTMDVEEKRVDSQAAVSLNQMKKIKELSEVMHLVNGRGGLEMSDAEKKYGDVGPMKKAIVARRNIGANKEIALADLAYKRTSVSSYLAQSDIKLLVGSKAVADIKKDEIINYNNVEYRFEIAETTQFFNNK